MLFVVFVAPGLVVAYALLLRPVLRRIPAFQTFYADADTFWQKVWALCGKSVTVAWGYILGGVGAAVSLVDPLASALGDPNVSDQVKTALQSNPKILGWFAIGVSVITIVARLRSIAKG